jgi:hypothetical protein
VNDDNQPCCFYCTGKVRVVKSSTRVRDALAAIGLLEQSPGRSSTVAGLVVAWCVPMSAQLRTHTQQKFNFFYAFTVINFS